MKSPNARHQDKWRERLLTRAEFFDDLDATRRRNLGDASKMFDDSPEAKAIRDFFQAYPRCYRYPIAVNGKMPEEPHFYISVDHYESTPYERAAVRVALAEVTSRIYELTSYNEDGSGGIWVPDEYDDIVRKEVAELRRLNLWVP